MNKLVLILQKILKDKLCYKSVEYKQGYNDAVEIVKIHGNITHESLHEVETLTQEIESLRATQSSDYWKDKADTYREIIKKQTESLTKKNLILKTIRKQYGITVDNNIKLEDYGS